MNSRRYNLYRLCAAILLTAVLFAMFRFFPLSGDDWFREGLGAGLTGISDLLRTVRDKWLTTNGRILGNILAYSAGSRPLLRDAMRTFITLLLILLLGKCSGFKSIGAKALAAAFALALPREMFRQIYPWAAGFFNYVPPVVILLGAFALVGGVFDNNEEKHGKWRAVALFFLGFAAQLFVENDTLYTIMAGAALIIWQLISRKKPSGALVCFFVGGVLGAVLLFISPSYLDIITNGNGYQMSITGGIAGLISTAGINHREVFSGFISGCPAIFMTVSVLSAFIYSRSGRRTVYDRLILGAILLFCFYFTLNIPAEFLPVLNTPACLLWVAAVLVGQIRWMPEGSGKLRSVFFLLSAVAAALPLLFVTPIGPRCMYISYIFMLAAAGNMVSAYEIKIPRRFSAAAGLIIFAVVAAFYIAKYIPLHNTDVRQRRIIAEAMESGDSTVTVPAYESGDWLWEPDCNKVEYAYYYETPGDLEIVFVDESGAANG